MYVCVIRDVVSVCVCVSDLCMLGKEGRKEGKQTDMNVRWAYLCEASSIIPPKFNPITSAIIFPNAAAVMVPIPKESPMLISM